jgi:hypothetical protein
MNQLTILPAASDPIGPVRHERPRTERSRDERSFDDALAAAEKLDGERPDRVTNRDSHRARPPARSESRRRVHEPALDDRSAGSAPETVDSPPAERTMPAEPAANGTDGPLDDATVPVEVSSTAVSVTAVAAATTASTTPVGAGSLVEDNAPSTVNTHASVGAPITTAAAPANPTGEDPVAAAMQRAEISVVADAPTPAPPTTEGDLTTAAPAPATPADRAGPAVPAPSIDASTAPLTPEAGVLAQPGAAQRAGGRGGSPGATTAEAEATTPPAPAVAVAGPSGTPSPVVVRRIEPATVTDAGSVTDAVRGPQSTTTTHGDEPLADSSATSAPAATTPGETTRPQAMRLAGRHRLALDLGNEGLGPLRMEALADGGTLHLNLLAGDRATTDAISARLPELRQDLESAGVRLGQLDVGTRQQDAGDHADRREPGPASPHAAAGAGRARPATDNPSHPRRVSARDGFDLRL